MKYAEYQFYVHTADGNLPIYRDVATRHPAAVHAVLGTENESDLQYVFDALRKPDWFDSDGNYRGEDADGIGLRCDCGSGLPLVAGHWCSRCMPF
jgi:hypothetical protein